jgi:hypothetical protein
MLYFCRVEHIVVIVSRVLSVAYLYLLFRDVSMRVY